MSKRAISQMSRSFGVIGLGLLFAQICPAAALAGGGISCASKNGKAEISISLTRQPIYAPSFATARLGDKQWVSAPQHGETELGPSQGLFEADKFSADFADKDVTKVIISLRVNLSAPEGEDGAPGTLTFEDGVPRKVFCQFE